VEHVVFFPAQDGNPAFRRLPSLDEAVRFVEHLRNTEGVTEVSVNALTPVHLTVRTVYRVEVAADAAGPVAAAPADVAEPPVDNSVAVPAVEPVADPAPVEAAAEAVEPVEAAPAPVEPVAEVPVQPDAEHAGAGNGAGDVRSLGFFAG